jgi:hypothetical protein
MPTVNGSSKRKTDPKQTVNSQSEALLDQGKQVDQEVDHPNEKDIVSLTP